MKLYIMKREALETLKANLPTLYGKYYTESTNKWINEICGEDPFIEYKDITDFKLADLDSDLSPGEVDFNNCKIIYENLQFLSESQASDERLWAGLTHTVFYDYMRKRWGYGYGKKPKSAKVESGAIKTRFFYQGAGRSGFYRNTLAKCWWVGRNTYDPSDKGDHFKSLDIIGSNDLNSKITEFFFSYSFSSNPDVLLAIIEALKQFKEEGKQLLVREHIRPALRYLNAVGGSVVIDCLPKDEITEIFYDAIVAIMQGDTPMLNLEKTVTDDMDYSDENPENDDDDVPEVVLGAKVFLRNDNGDIKKYKYDEVDGKLPNNLEALTGHKVGDIIELKGQLWKIDDIVF